MKTGILFLILFAVLIPFVSGKDVRVIGVEDLKEILSDSTDNLYVINFWATWCGPCVTELPYFQQLSENYSNKNVKFLLVSLDFPSQLESKLIPFLKENKIMLEVVLMSELDYGKWMPMVDENWKGNIPATLVFNNASGKHAFIPGALDKNEINRLISLNLE